MVDIVDKALRMGEGQQIKKLRTWPSERSGGRDRALGDGALRAQNPQFKRNIENGESLTSSCRKPPPPCVSFKRTLGLRHFDVQLMGGAALHWGNIAEMKTGEGKTLGRHLAYLPERPRRSGRHVVTVNDYLPATRAELMGRVYRFLGMTPAASSPTRSRRSVASSTTPTSPTAPTTSSVLITCATTWHGRKPDLVQRGHHYAIVDEVDSILIDEARTPLIISGPAEGDVTRWYRQFARLVLKLNRDEDYEVDEKKKVVGILDPGITKVEDYLGIDNLYEPNNTALIGYLEQRHQGQGAVPARPRLRRDRRRSAHRRRAPDVSCRAAVTTRVCTKPSKPRKAWRSRPRTRPSPPSPCRTTSACTTSSRA